MNFDLSDEQKMLADQTRRLLTERESTTRLREIIAGDEQWDEPLWREFAQMGLLSTAIPCDYGGLGLSDLDLGVISEELGRSNAAIPFFSSIVLAAAAIGACGTDSQKSRWLPRIAAGDTIATLAYAEGPAGGPADAYASRYDEGSVTGTKSPVADAGVATLAVVLVRHEGNPALVVVDLESPRVTRRKLVSFDRLRCHFSVAFDRAPAELLPGSISSDAVESLFDRAAVQAGFEAVGGAESCLYMARSYALQRQIFGRPLASYQAIKHKLADILVSIELARSSAYFGAWAATSAPDELAPAAAGARLTSIKAFEAAARENLQIHGGFGYTMESNCHFYYRRERTLALSLGGRHYWSERIMNNMNIEARRHGRQ